MKNQHPFWLLLFYCLCFSQFSHAQEKGLVVLLIRPYDALLKIDNKVYDLSKEAFPFEIELVEGQYKAQIWASNYNIHTIDLEVKANRPIQIVRQLDDFSENYIIYQEEYEVYKTDKGTDRFLIAANVGATLGYALLMLKLNKDVDEHVNNTNIARDNYAAGVAEISLDNARNKFNFERDKFEKKQNTHNILLIAGGVGLGALYGLTYRYFKKRKGQRKTKPTYQSSNPFANISIDVYPGLTIDDQSTPTELGLKWTF